MAFPFLGLLAITLFLAFAASGITWLVATVMPTTNAVGRRQVGIVAIVSGALLAAVLFSGAILAPQRARVPYFRPPGPVPGQPQPLPQPQQPTPTR